MSTAATMIAISSTSPTAVRTESIENTMSSRTIWKITEPNDAALAPGSSAWPDSPSRDSWISVVALYSRNRPPRIRIASRHEKSRPKSVTSGWVSPMIQEIVSSRRIRIPAASPSPTSRA